MSDSVRHPAEASSPFAPGSFAARVAAADPSALSAVSVDTLELNVGYRCSLSCTHCHVEASPERTESMSPHVFAAALRLAERLGPGLIDLTGGAPELHPEIRRFVHEFRAAGFPVQMRTNLVSLLEPEAVGLAEYLAHENVGLLASLPSVVPAQVDSQRGAGTWQRSVLALRMLGEIGYGTAAGPRLDIATNPTGEGLPGDRDDLESRYRESLGRIGISFGRLVIITNVPVGRYLAELRRAGTADRYMRLLASRFNPETLPRLGCRRSIAIAWDGAVYDCDFQLSADAPRTCGMLPHVTDESADERLHTRRIMFAEYCAACAAASGSS
jgi:radical SAM/Cys-rich protein